MRAVKHIIDFLCLPGETFAVSIFPADFADCLVSQKIQQLSRRRMEYFSSQLDALSWILWLKCYFNEKMLFSFSVDSDFIFGKNALP